MKAAKPTKTKTAKLRTVVVEAGAVIQDDLFGEVQLQAAADAQPIRQVVLDTETTGINHAEGDRVIEIGCVELVDRAITGRSFHCYLNPDREIDEGAVRVHGLTNGFLMDKPRFRDVVVEFLAFIKDAEIIAHNAPFDTAFLNAELRRLSKDPSYTVEAWTSKITDTLKLARKLWPGKKNSLDALVKRYNVTHHTRDFHGALLDAQILADVYLLMSGAQYGIHLQLDADDDAAASGIRRIDRDELRGGLRVLRAKSDELEAHERMLAMMRKKLEGAPILWDQVCGTAAPTPDTESKPAARLVHSATFEPSITSAAEPANPDAKAEATPNASPDADRSPAPAPRAFAFI